MQPPPGADRGVGRQEPPRCQADTLFPGGRWVIPNFSGILRQHMLSEGPSRHCTPMSVTAHRVEQVTALKDL